MRRLRLGCVAVALPVALAACGDPNEPPAVPMCDGPVTVSVGTGTQPEFTWSPACRVEVLTVGRPENTSVEWIVLANPSSRRAIAPPVRYGVLPAEALDLTFGNPAPLAAGTTYYVSVSVVNAPGGEEELGRAEFVP